MGSIKRIIKGESIYQAKEINLWAIEDDINLNAADKVIFHGEQGGVVYSDYTDPPLSKHIQSIEWQNADSILINKNIELPTSITPAYKYSNICYGELVKVVIKTKKKAGKKFKVKIQSYPNGNFIKEYDILVDKQGKAETELFRLPLSEYDETIENYDYIFHRTVVEESKITQFHISIEEQQFTYLPESLIPYTYRRNYEELIGLFDKQIIGSKSNTTNYENKFIDYNTKIASIVDNFISFITKDNSLTISDIRNYVEKQSEALWKAAIKQVQTGNLDDRPLYWARNKMQAWLKRHPLFKDQLNFTNSQVKKGTCLEEIIQIFEEKSRNYTGVDFSKTPEGVKKVLITGFDPFLLNSINHSDQLYFNILQSNPSGVVALALAENQELGAYIQTMMIPVRYTDFDGSQNHSTGQGEGIIEKYIKPWISEVDMVITVSQYLPNENVIDMFGTSRRGGYYDNMNFRRKNGSQALSTQYEWIETTLPKSFAQIPQIKFNWEFISKSNGQNTKENIYPNSNEILSGGSGGAYLSNEIFYRVAKLRKELRPTLSTGHFHIEKLQDETKREDFSSEKTVGLLDIVKQGIKGL